MEGETEREIVESKRNCQGKEHWLKTQDGLERKFFRKKGNGETGGGYPASERGGEW